MILVTFVLDIYRVRFRYLSYSSQISINYKLDITKIATFITTQYQSYMRTLNEIYRSQHFRNHLKNRRKLLRQIDN